MFCEAGEPTTIYAWWKLQREYLVILLGNWLTDLRISGDRSADFQWSLRFIESRKQTNSLKILENLSLAPALTFLTVSLLFNLPFPALCVTPFLTSQFTLTYTSFPPYLFSYISPSLIFLVVSEYYCSSLVVFEVKDVIIDRSLSTTEHLLVRNTRNK